MRELIERHAGGMRDGFALRAVLPGGASTPFVPADAIDVVMDFDHMKQAGYSLGTGTALLVDDSVCPVGLTLNLRAFLRPGVVRLVHALLGWPALDGRRSATTSRKGGGVPSISSCWPSRCGL